MRKPNYSGVTSFVIKTCDAMGVRYLDSMDLVNIMIRACSKRLYRKPEDLIEWLRSDEGHAELLRKQG
jgi:hypothetical protein